MTNQGPNALSRRGFLKRGTLAGAALASGVTAGCSSPSTRSQASADDVDLRLAGYPLDRVQGLMDGRVEIEGFSYSFEKAPIYDLNNAAMGGDQRWEAQEIGIHPYMLSFANEGFRDYTLLPVFPLRTFRHKSIFVHTDSGIRTAEDLRGRRVATAGYSQSSLVWIRGILQHEYGVRPEEMNWVASVKTSEGGVSANESQLPTNVPITMGTEGKDESQLLMDGEVDAVFSAKEPQAYIDGDPKVVRLFADYRQVEHAYYESTGIFPIMHAVAVRADVVERHPEVLSALFQAYSEAKSLNYAFMRDLGWAMSSLPWYPKELEETRALMGDNFWPYGIAPNRKALEALFQYSHEQGFCDRQLTIEELFHPSTLSFLETA